MFGMVRGPPKQLTCGTYRISHVCSSSVWPI